MAAATQNTDETLASTDEQATTKQKHVIKPIKLQKHRIPKLVMKSFRPR